MKFIETRGNDGNKPVAITFSQAILSPMSSFGGIYSPENLPVLDDVFFRAHIGSGYKTLAKDILQAFDVDIEPSVIDAALAQIAMERGEKVDRNHPRYKIA